MGQELPGHPAAGRARFLRASPEGALPRGGGTLETDQVTRQGKGEVTSQMY